MWLIKDLSSSILGSSQMSRRARDPKPDAKQLRTNHVYAADILNKRWKREDVF